MSKRAARREPLGETLIETSETPGTPARTGGKRRVLPGARRLAPRPLRAGARGVQPLCKPARPFLTHTLTCAGLASVVHTDEGSGTLSVTSDARSGERAAGTRQDAVQTAGGTRLTTLNAARSREGARGRRRAAGPRGHRASGGGPAGRPRERVRVPRRDHAPVELVVTGLNAEGLTHG